MYIGAAYRRSLARRSRPPTRTAVCLSERSFFRFSLFRLPSGFCRRRFPRSFAFCRRRFPRSFASCRWESASSESQCNGGACERSHALSAAVLNRQRCGRDKDRWMNGCSRRLRGWFKLFVLRSLEGRVCGWRSRQGRRQQRQRKQQRAIEWATEWLNYVWSCLMERLWATWFCRCRRREWKLINIKISKY